MRREPRERGSRGQFSPRGEERDGERSDPRKISETHDGHDKTFLIAVTIGTVVDASFSFGSCKSYMSTVTAGTSNDRSLEGLRFS